MIDSAVSSGSAGRSTSVTAASTVDGEDEPAGAGPSLVVDGFRHLQITTRIVPVLKRTGQRPAPPLCTNPGSTGASAPAWAADPVQAGRGSRPASRAGLRPRRVA